MTTQHSRGPVVVLGAGGRAGRAVVAESRARGHAVTAVVREPTRHADLDRPGVALVRGDATDPEFVRTVAAGAVALVNCVTPFSSPPATFEDFDGNYYVHLARTLMDAAAGSRIVEIGLAATLRVGERRLYEDPAAFPAFLRPFAEARSRGLVTWTDHGRDVDWLVLTPPPNLTPDAPPTGRYRLGDDTLDPDDAGAPLSYADLALAVLDEIDTPTRRREQVAVYSVSS